MKNSVVFTGLLICLLGFFRAAPAAALRKIPAPELFYIKCTKCHGADESLKRHASKEQFLAMIRTMQLGANISDREMERIAAFLGHPDRPLFEVKCTRCHDMNRIRQARLERKKDAAIKALVERMRKLDTAWISEKNAQEIYRYLISVY
jgi:hypothetical protein